MSKLSKELCNRLSTRQKTFTVAYDVLIGISKYSHTVLGKTDNIPTYNHTVHCFHKKTLLSYDLYIPLNTRLNMRYLRVVF